MKPWCAPEDEELLLFVALGADVRADVLDERLQRIVARADTFFIGSADPEGNADASHRGGNPGFLQVVDPRTLAFSDLPGNRQFISVGNLAQDDRVALILVDYAHRRRLKLLGRLAVQESPTAGRTQREMTIHVEAFDWNCPKYIPVRFEAEDVQRALHERDERIAQLEAQLAEALRQP